MKQKFYRAPWSKEKVDLLMKWWPHFGTIIMSKMLSISKQSVKSKADKLKLKLLQKNKRICIECRKEHQFARYAGVRCHRCHLERRKILRRQEKVSLDKWVARAVNTVRHRSQILSDLTTLYMIELWNKQQGKCFYSDIEMTIPQYGSGRNPFSPSIDRIEPSKGYVKGNVVWACWICNAGKNDLSVVEYINVCQKVANKNQNGNQNNER